MKKVDISIIVPIYNAERYLKECIDSLLMQSKAECEFILINDGSTDRSEKIIKSYQDNRIQYFKKKNQGIGKTRNFGIEKAKGKYLMFIDSDDYINPNTCKILFEQCEKEKLDIGVCNFYKDYEDKKREEVILPSFENTTLKERPNLLNEINLSPWNKMYKREFIVKNKIKFEEKLKYEDVPFVVEALDKAKKIGKIDQSLNHYRVHTQSETAKRDEKCFDILKIIDKIRIYLKEKDYMKESLDQLTVRMVTNYTIQQRMQVEKEIGNRFIEEAFAYLEKEVPDYKDNKYYKERGMFRRTIEKNLFLTKLYCKLYK